MPLIIEQFLPAFHDGDAVGNSTLSFHRYLLAQGIESRIVAMTIDEILSPLAVDFKTYKPHPQSLKILHFAIPSPLTDYFLELSGPKAMIYHNVTPPEFFVDYSEDLTRFTNLGRHHLARLVRAFDFSIADSSYNAQELLDLGFENVTVFPIMIDLDAYEAKESTAYRNLHRDERKNMLFVGRISPNKGIEELVKVLFFYKKYLSANIRLIVAGNTRSLPKYFYALRDLAARFLLTGDDIVFTGHIPFEELLSVYRASDLFISLSGHEGFCLPLIESMVMDLPVLARGVGAVPETLGGAGLLVGDHRVDEIAALAERILEDPSLSALLRQRGRQRLADYRRESDPSILLKMIRQAVGDA
jgi:glycosyltransferase involved in cell wall biosynthesis